MERDQARKISTRQTCDPKMPHVGRHGAAGTSANNGQKWLCVFLGLPHLIFLLGPGVREFAELGPVLKPPDFDTTRPKVRQSARRIEQRDAALP